MVRRMGGEGVAGRNGMTLDRTPTLIGEAEREAALAQLREACVDGRLTLEEFSDRVEAALTARTSAQLAASVADLGPAAPVRRETVQAEDRIIALLGDSKRTGRWRLKPRTTAIALAGDCELDLRRAEVTSAEVEIVAYALMGDVEVIVPPGFDVELSGVALMGDKEAKLKRSRPLPGAPLIRVKAYAIMGDVEVKCKD
jgi:hypothetical protein